MPTTDLRTFLEVSIPSMLMFGMRHALEVDHITSIDNLVRMHNAKKRARWVGLGFSIGHILAVLSEMLLIIYVVGSTTSSKIDEISFWGGVIGAISLGVIGSVNIYSMKRWGKTGSAILASKVVTRTHILGPLGSAFATGLVFGIGFDTATQISALSLTVVASAALGVQIALALVGFFGIGMIFVDTIDSIVVRSVFSKILDTKVFKYMSYALSVVALTVASLESYAVITSTNTIPILTGPILAIIIITIAFGYGFATSNKRKTKGVDKEMQQNELQNKNVNHSRKDINHDSDDYELNLS
jgi:nickel/cobalt transporter (NiCoT) family protein